jgi:beta-galactosidase
MIRMFSIRPLLVVALFVALKTNGAENKNQIAANFELRTAGKPSKILLKADRPNLTAAWDDLAYIEATVVDRNGILVPDAAQQISFKVTGPGTIAAVDNGDNASHEFFHAYQRHAYQGRCFAIIKANAAGRISIKASADGLASAKIEVMALRK